MRINDSSISRKHILANLGKKYNRLTVISFEYKKGGRTYYKLKCDCGKEIIISLSCAKTNHTKSCGCLVSELSRIRMPKYTRKHGISTTRIYKCWKDAVRRCEDLKSVAYQNYGGRGINICEEWKDCLVFYEWALKNGYSETLTLDRINVDGNYEPSNCKWATIDEQANNKRNSIFICHEGLKLTHSQWSKRLGGSARLVSGRIKRYGWDEIRAITTLAPR